MDLYRDAIIDIQKNTAVQRRKLIVQKGEYGILPVTNHQVSCRNWQ